MLNPAIRIISLNVGKPAVFAYQGKEIETGIFKHPVNEPLYLSKTNLDGDGQADLVYHGGPEKAVCVYPHEHYPYWTERLSRQLDMGAFGENLTVEGLREESVCIGDIFQWGEAVVQISQPRQPCHKLAKKYDVPELPLWVQETGYTGFYFRVLQEGRVAMDQLQLIERHPAGVTVQFANQIMHLDKQNREGIERILAVDALSVNWCQTLTKRLAGVQTDTSARLNG